MSSWCRRCRAPEDIHYIDRLLAQLEARAGLARPILVHAILETARGVANVEEIAWCQSPRMQGISLGPADLAADRRMKTTRVGGGHPGYLVRQDPVDGDIDGARTTYQQDLWHYTIARMVDACAMHGIFPYYGPFGDIKPMSSRARTSSATPSSLVVWAPGRCTRCRSRSRRRSSRPPWAMSRTRDASRRRWVTGRER
jgi:citrate lyase beta subunit